MSRGAGSLPALHFGGSSSARPRDLWEFFPFCFRDNNTCERMSSIGVNTLQLVRIEDVTAGENARLRGVARADAIEEPAEERERRSNDRMGQGPPTASTTDASPRLAKTLRLVLRPLVKLMLSHDLPFRSAAGLLKQVYVDVAMEELDRLGKRPADSRLSMMTGIHRKELKRLRDGAGEDADVPRSVSLGAQLVTRWTTDAIYLDDAGRPLTLRRNTQASGNADDVSAASFDDLVMSVSTDIHPRAVLDEWQRLGVVEIDDDKNIHLLTSAFIPRQGFEEKLFFLGRNVHDHLDTTVRNLESDEPSRLERSVHYDNVAPSDVNLLARFAEQEGMKLLEAVNRRALELRGEARERGETTPHPADEKSERMNFGLYFYRGPRRDSLDDADEAAGGDEGADQEMR
jgi:hypothetical protein